MPRSQSIDLLFGTAQAGARTLGIPAKDSLRSEGTREAGRPRYQVTNGLLALKFLVRAAAASECLCITVPMALHEPATVPCFRSTSTPNPQTEGFVKAHERKAERPF